MSSGLIEWITSNKKRRSIIIQISLTVGFSAAYAAIESLVLEKYLKALPITEQPVLGGLYPYHLFLMLPTFAAVSLLIGHDKRLRSDPTNLRAWARTIINALQTFPNLAVMEDAMYFVIRGFDPRYPDTYGIHNIRPEDWTCLHHGGCVDAGFTQIPVWYFAGMALSTLSWIIDNLVFKQQQKKGY